VSPEMNPEVLLLLLHHQPAHRPVAGDFTATAVTFAAMALFDHLDGEKRQRVVVPMDDENRRDWIFFPESGRRGVPLRDLDRTQLYLAHRLIAQSMSVEGYAQVVQAMSLESILRELEHPARVQPTGLRARGFAPRGVSASWRANSGPTCTGWAGGTPASPTPTATRCSADC